MSEKNICQSCTIPLDSPDLLGTEKDGSNSTDYCKYCYQNGHFTHPEMTLNKMEKRMLMQMQKQKLPKEVIERAVSRLPFLKRWATKVTID